MASSAILDMIMILLVRDWGRPRFTLNHLLHPIPSLEVRS